MIAFLLFFLVYEQENVNLDWLNIKFVWGIRNFEQFPLYLQPFSRMLQFVFIEFKLVELSISQVIKLMVLTDYLYLC